MNDNDKANFGLSPMRAVLDTSSYSNGCYADSADTVAAMIKWALSPYPNVYRYAVYIWQDKPSWYSGNILYKVVAGSALSETMANTALFYTILEPDVQSYTFTGLTPNRTYYCTVQAIADSAGGYLSDVYVTEFVAVCDTLTPKIISVVEHDDYFNVFWKPYSGSDPLSYTLYVWHGDQTWYHGEDWYPVSGDPELSVQLASSSEQFDHLSTDTAVAKIYKTDGVNVYKFGVIAWLNYDPYVYTNVYIVPVNVLNIWKWAPRGEWAQTVDWGTNTIDFETGLKHYQQKFTKPTRTFTATFSGLSKTWYEMRNFIDAHRGDLLPFYIDVDEYDRVVRYAVRLAEPKFNPKLQTEVVWGRTLTGLARRQVVGFEIELSFVEDKSYEPVVISES